MTGLETGGLMGLAAIFGGVANWTRERWKGVNASKELDIKRDHQEAAQAVALAPIWQDILAKVEFRCSGLEALLAAQSKEHKEQIEIMRSEHYHQIEVIRSEHIRQSEMLQEKVNTQAVQYARLDSSYVVLKDRVKSLESQLDQAFQRHSNDAGIIASLQAELTAVKAATLVEIKAIRDKSEREAQENNESIIDMEARLLEAEKEYRIKSRMLAESEELRLSMIQQSHNQPEGATAPHSKNTTHES